MSNTKRGLMRVFVVCLVMAVNAFSATLISDFAPLQVNNIWKYKAYTFLNMGSGVTSIDSSLRTMVVKSKIQSGDTASYKITIRDSLFSRTLITVSGSRSDTTHPADQILTDSGMVLEAKDGSLSSPPSSVMYILQTFFYKHTVPDIDISGKITVGGQTSWTYSPGGAVTYAQNLGLLTYDIISQETYRLISFNGTSLGNFTVVGILDTRPSNKRLTLLTPVLSNFEIIRGTNRNVLGRFSIPQNIVDYK